MRRQRKASAGESLGFLFPGAGPASSARWAVSLALAVGLFAVGAAGLGMLAATPTCRCAGFEDRLRSFELRQAHQQVLIEAIEARQAERPAWSGDTVTVQQGAATAVTGDWLREKEEGTAVQWGADGGVTVRVRPMTVPLRTGTTTMTVPIKIRPLGQPPP